MTTAPSPPVAALPECGHEYVEMMTAVDADGLCPICLRAAASGLGAQVAEALQAVKGREERIDYWVKDWKRVEAEREAAEQRADGLASENRRLENEVEKLSEEWGQRERADAADRNLANFKWALDGRIAERNIAVGLASGLPQFKDKPMEEVLEFVQAAAIESAVGHSITRYKPTELTEQLAEQTARASAAEASAQSAVARVAELERDAAVGRAIDRAAKELPDNYEIYIELERGAGTVRLFLPDETTRSDFDDADSFASQINKAIDFALKA